MKLSGGTLGPITADDGSYLEPALHALKRETGKRGSGNSVLGTVEGDRTYPDATTRDLVLASSGLAARRRQTSQIGRRGGALLRVPLHHEIITASSPRRPRRRWRTPR